VDDTAMPVYRLPDRTYLVNRADRLYTDSTLIRFEDAKLNPKAAFPALCAFLDLPYTQSMIDCSENGEKKEKGVGFGTAPVFRSYLQFAGYEELRRRLCNEVKLAKGVSAADMEAEELTPRRRSGSTTSFSPTAG